MIPISSALSGGLSWSKTPYKRGYQLKRDGEIVGSLQQSSFWKMEYQADSTQGNWKFRRTGCFRTNTEIVDPTTDAPIALFKPNWTGGGLLTFSDGLRFQITCKGFWRPVWTVATEGGRPVLTIFVRDKAVQISDDSNLLEDRLTLLTIFGWHVIQQAAEEAASTAALTVVTP